MFLPRQDLCLRAALILTFDHLRAASGVFHPASWLSVEVASPAEIFFFQR